MQLKSINEIIWLILLNKGDKVFYHMMFIKILFIHKAMNFFINKQVIIFVKSFIQYGKEKKNYIPNSNKDLAFLPDGIRDSLVKFI